jgi:DNA-binding PadR family transcriptional regulator
VRVSLQTISVLRALKEIPGSWSYGYDLSKLTGIRSGTLYPILARFHDEGWLDTKWTDAEGPGRPPRHLYRLTATGSREAARILSRRHHEKAGTRLALES